ncbi:unnamed protein product [Pylaiella littoralis]
MPPPAEILEAVPGFDLRSGISAGANLSFSRQGFSSTGARPVKAIQPLDDDCNTLVYGQGGRFWFAINNDNATATTTTTTTKKRCGPSRKAAAGTAGGGGDGEGGTRKRGGGGGGGGNGGGGGGAVFESLPVHSGSIMDFRVNSLSRDIVSGCDHGHVHVVNFSSDMLGVPTMKVSKYVAQPLSSVRWGLDKPYVASWTSSRGLLQMLDIRDNRVLSSIQVEGALPVHTHEYLSDVVLAVACGSGCVQLFDVRKMEAFVTLQDPVAGSIHQIVPSVSGDNSAGSSGVSDWATFGITGVSRYTMGASSSSSSSSSNNPAGAAVGVSPDESVLARVAAGLSYAAGCRTGDLKLSAKLDMNAGLFLVPSPSGCSQHRHQEQRLCGITLDSRVIAFTSVSASSTNCGRGGIGSGGNGNGSGSNGNGSGSGNSKSKSSRSKTSANGGAETTLLKDANRGHDVDAAAAGSSSSPPPPPSSRPPSSVAPAHGSKVAGGGGVPRGNGSGSGSGGGCSGGRGSSGRAAEHGAGGVNGAGSGGGGGNSCGREVSKNNNVGVNGHDRKKGGRKRR